MRLQVLSSGSRGNACLVRAGETRALLDAGLTMRELSARLDAVGVPSRSLHHIAVTHGHLDHARSAGALSHRASAPVTCSERIMRNRSIERAHELRAIRFGSDQELESPCDEEPLVLRPVHIPHDADPTAAFRVEHRGRVSVVLTDMGRPDPGVARALAGAHVLVLEFNHDEGMLRGGPYPAKLKRRIAGDGGHLSNEQAREVLRALAGPELHTLVLAHLSAHNNTPELALEAAHAELSALGLDGVRVEVARQDAPLEAIEV